MSQDRRDDFNGAPPAPGDLFVLPETAELPVEWAVLDRDPGRPDRFLAVPADASPLAGSADVVVSEEEPGGPLSLRCAHPVWIDGAALAPERRTGSLAPGAVEAARRKVREVAAGQPKASPLAWEVDQDPEYRDWLAETAAPAKAAVEVRAAGRREPEGRLLRFPPPMLRFLAAALLALSLGLSVWVALLTNTVRQLSEPELGVAWEEIELGGGRRGPVEEVVLRVPPEARSFQLSFVFGRRIAGREGRLEIVGPGDEVRWRSPLFDIEPGEDNLILPRRRFPDGRYRVRLMEGEGPGGRVLEEVLLRVEAAGAAEAEVVP